MISPSQHIVLDTRANVLLTISCSKEGLKTIEMQPYYVSHWLRANACDCHLQIIVYPFSQTIS